MGKHIQIREVDETMHREIKAQAARAGMSLSEYLKRLIATDLKRPNWEAIRKEMESKPRPDLSGVDIAQIVREERESRYPL